MERLTVEQVCWVFEKIIDNAKVGGSFRHLIYDEMGFESKDYEALYHAGGMDITNSFDMEEDPIGHGGKDNADFKVGDKVRVIPRMKPNLRVFKSNNKVFEVKDIKVITNKIILYRIDAAGETFWWPKYMFVRGEE